MKAKGGILTDTLIGGR
jgi:hypothetical protein